MTKDYASSLSFVRFRRSILSMKRNPVVHSVDNQTNESLLAQEHELQVFQENVTQMFENLSLVESHELLSVSWVSRLLDAFICCQEEFRVILSNNKSYLAKQGMEKSFTDYFERSVKGLDVCNAIRDGIERMQQWRKQLEIVVFVLGDRRNLGQGQFQRVKKALKDLAIKIDDEKESSVNVAQRNRSFNQKDLQRQESECSKHLRSLSWSVSRSWSASKQLQAIGNNIVVPKSSEIIATNGFVLAVYTMSHVLSFVMWVLVAAIPCQDRRLQSQFNISKNFPWSHPIVSLQERILEEYKKRDKRNSCGLLKEIHGIETYTSYMNGFIDSARFPLEEEQEEEVKKSFEELSIVYESLKNGLNPLERRVRGVFHGIVRCRFEGLDSITRRCD